MAHHTVGAGDNDRNISSLHRDKSILAQIVCSKDLLLYCASAIPSFPRPRGLSLWVVMAVLMVLRCVFLHVQLLLGKVEVMKGRRSVCRVCVERSHNATPQLRRARVLPINAAATRSISSTQNFAGIECLVASLTINSAQPEPQSRKIEQFSQQKVDQDRIQDLLTVLERRLHITHPDDWYSVKLLDIKEVARLPNGFSKKDLAGWPFMRAILSDSPIQRRYQRDTHNILGIWCDFSPADKRAKNYLNEYSSPSFR